MPSLSNIAKNTKSLSNENDNAEDITVDEATMTVDDATRMVDGLGLPITKITKNIKTLSNEAENL